MDIDFWQALKGTQTRLNITRYEVCDTCHGTGSTGTGEVTCPQCKGTGNVTQMAGAMRFNLTCPRCGGTGTLRNACPTCGGDGRVTRTEAVDIRIPPGARNGLPDYGWQGKGNAGTMGAPPGDLYITTKLGWRSTPSFTAMAMTSKSKFRWRCGRRRWGPRSKCRPSMAGPN